MVDIHGEHLFWASENQAHQLLKKRQVRLVRRRGHTRLLVATADFATEYNALDRGRGTALDATRYSHNHETGDNPEKVWTLKRLPRSTRPVFTAVLDECLTPAA